MKKSDIKVGSTYEAKISGGATIVKVNTIEEYEGRSSKAFNGRIKLTEYHCTNMETGRRVVLRSAAKFIKEVEEDKRIFKSEAQMIAFREILRQGTFSPELPTHVIDQLEAEHRDKEASEEANPIQNTNAGTAEQVIPSVQNATVSDSTESDIKFFGWMCKHGYHPACTDRLCRCKCHN